jgi:hypothetical protein
VGGIHKQTSVYPMEKVEYISSLVNCCPEVVGFKQVVYLWVAGEDLSENCSTGATATDNEGDWLASSLLAIAASVGSLLSRPTQPPILERPERGLKSIPYRKIFKNHSSITSSKCI